MNSKKTIHALFQSLLNYPIPILIEEETSPWFSDYEAKSALINYAMVRYFGPRTVVEFGARGGRCTHDLLLGLLHNQQEFILKPYEISDRWRKIAQENLDKTFKHLAPTVGGDIMKATDIPDNIDYLFVDNSHDYKTTKWVFEYLLPKKCVDNCLVHFDDIVIYGDFKFSVDGGVPKDNEMAYFYELEKKGELPLKKVFWGWEEGIGISSSWWRYTK